MDKKSKSKDLDFLARLKGFFHTLPCAIASLTLVAHGLCNHSPKGCNSPYGEPPLFESLTKYKKIKKGTNPCGLIPFLIGWGIGIFRRNAPIAPQAACPRRRKQSTGLFSSAYAPSLFESLTKHKKIKKEPILTD